MTYPSRQVSISINRSVEDVYRFASNGANLPAWAEGLSNASIIQSGDEWIANSPMGVVKIKISAKNNLGVLDHEVTLPNGHVNYNPLRVVRNDKGSEVIFTLYCVPGMNDENFEDDERMIENDLQRLKNILEQGD